MSIKNNYLWVADFNNGFIYEFNTNTNPPTKTMSLGGGQQPKNISFDGKIFNIFSTSITKHYQNNTLYVYYLKETR
jgi:DNA-binding beta-propeller fold protein YncE